MDTVTRALYQSETGFLHVSQIEALDYNLDDRSLRRTLMTSPYTPRPALKTAAGYIVHLSVQKRFPAFLRCNALHFASENDFAHAELAASPAEFRNAVARLSPNPILGPLSGGVPVVLYLASRGLEEDFKEFASEIQEDGLQRLATIPDQDAPIVLVFGDPEAMEEQTINAPTPVPQAQVNAPTRPEVQTRHVASLPPPTPQPIAEVTTPPPAPEPTPVTVQPERQPAPVAPAQPEVAQPELAPTLVSEPAPIPIPTPTPTLEAVVTQPPTALPPPGRRLLRAAPPRHQRHTRRRGARPPFDGGARPRRIRNPSAHRCHV